MFGYIKAYKPELRFREYEYYRAAYCGLCRAMGKCGGCRARATLSYDMVFALLARMAVSGTSPEFYTGTCALHPLKKRTFMKLNPELEFTARASAMLAYEKLSDDVADERGVKRLAARIARANLKKSNALASAALPELSGKISEGLAELSALEEKNEPSVDMPADIFGSIMANIMSYGYGGANEKIAREIGMRAGRWVYILDALDDCEDDQKKGRYNPFLALDGKCPNEAQKREMLLLISAEPSAIKNALDLAEREDRRDLFEILENVLTYGMKQSAESVISLKAKKGRNK